MIIVQPNHPKLYRHELTYFRAIQAGPEFSKDDIITLNERINQSDEKSENVIWKNRTSGFLLSNVPAIGIDVELLENARLKLSSESVKLKVDNPVTLKNIPDAANFAQIHVIGGNVIYTLDGITTPNSGKGLLGIRKKDWDTFELQGRDEVLKFQALPLDDNAHVTLYVEFSQIIVDHS
jgi:hypothetical protein